MKTQLTLDELAAHGAPSAIRDDVQVDVYRRHLQPVAVVLWRAQEPQPFMAFRDSDDGRLNHFSVTSNDDIPEHDAHSRLLHTRVELYERADQPVAIRIMDGASGQELLSIGGAPHPLELQSFNRRNYGAFASGFRDLDGLPVADTVGARLRAALHGRAGRAWERSQTAELVAAHRSSDVSALLMAVAERARDDEWRLAHQDEGIVANGEFERILREFRQRPENPPPSARPPLVRILDDRNTYSFDVATQAAHKLVSVQQYTDFTDTSLQADFPYGSVTGWSAKVPKTMRSLEAVDMVGRDFFVGWDSMHKSYRGGAATLTPPPYDPLDMDEAVQYSREIGARFDAGEHAEAFAMWRQDPNGGAAAGTPVRDLPQFVARMYSTRDVQGRPIHRQPDGYAFDGLTVGHQARLADDYPWAKLSHLWQLDGQTFVTIDFDRPVTLDNDERVATLTVPAHKILRTRPSTGLSTQHAEGQVDGPGRLSDDKSLARDHSGGLPGMWEDADLGGGATDIDQARSNVGGAIQGSELRADPGTRTQRPFEPADGPDGLNEDQRQAVNAFRASHGRDWKRALGQCWMAAHYPGTNRDDAALLQQVRNSLGPEWLAQVTRKELEKATDRCVVSIHREVWKGAPLGGTHPDQATPVVDQQSVNLADLPQLAAKFQIRDVASAEVETPDAYVWFTSAFEPPADGERGAQQRHALHIHSVNGREPRQQDYRAITERLGIATAAVDHEVAP